MAATTARVRDRHDRVEVTQVRSDADPRNALLDHARQAAMVVLGSRGRGPVASLLLGSVSVAVSTHASCPVVVLRPDARPGEGILVGVDGTRHSRLAIEFAYRTASLWSCPLTVMHCYNGGTRGAAALGASDAPGTNDEEALTAESLAGMHEKFPDVPMTAHVVPGRGAPELLAASDGSALLVVGHHRRGPLHGLLHDTVAPTVLEHARCPVAVVTSA